MGACGLFGKIFTFSFMCEAMRLRSMSVGYVYGGLALSLLLSLKQHLHRKPFVCGGANLELDQGPS